MNKKFYAITSIVVLIATVTIIIIVTVISDDKTKEKNIETESDLDNYDNYNIKDKKLIIEEQFNIKIPDGAELIYFTKEKSSYEYEITTGAKYSIKESEYDEILESMKQYVQVKSEDFHYGMPNIDRSIDWWDLKKEDVIHWYTGHTLRTVEEYGLRGSIYIFITKDSKNNIYLYLSHTG